MKWISILIQAAFCAGLAQGQGARPERNVMTWVPPYAIQSCQKTLQTLFDDEGVSNGLTRLGLQFWEPTPNGGVARVTRYGVLEDSQIQNFQAWGRRHQVAVLLCVYNGTSKWDWDLAGLAFDHHRAHFIDALLEETLKFDLDGIDIDLEGIGNLNSSKGAFVAFIRELSDRLDEQGKILTVDSFPYIWNAPNRTWWPELLPLIEGLNVMGYTNTGAHSKDWQAYESLEAVAGEHASKLLMGVAGYTSVWENASVQTHVEWIVENQSVGLAIWDAQFRDPVWRTPALWERISKIKNHNEWRKAPDDVDAQGTSGHP
jgi:hypothetical protein